jgi:CubicO group peptidase (beta-lactamase class C family)
LAIAAQVTLPGDVVSAIDRVVDDDAQQRSVPWLVVAVVADGAVVHLRAAGIGGNVGQLSEHTAFPIASMTKSFTAATVLSLRDDGLLALDTPLGELEPKAAAIAPPTDDSPALTIRHLLTMAGGLATDDPWGDRQLAQPPVWFDALLAAGVTFAHPPGVTMEYSNLSYALLGRVVEAVTGQRCPEVINERIIRPLGLARTVWDASELPPGTLVAEPFRMVGGLPERDAAPLGTGAFAPMGGLWSTAADLAQWVHFLSSAFPPRDGHDGGPLRRSSRREMQQLHRAAELDPAVHTGGLPAVHLGYGMGLQIVAHRSLGAVIAHSGGLPGYGSHMRWAPGRRVGVVALGNRTYPGLGAVTSQVLDLLADAGCVPALSQEVSPTLRHAVDEIVALVNEWDDQRAAALFAGNVALDEPLDRRSAALRTLRERSGELRVAAIRAASATAGDAELVGVNGMVRLEVLLSPESPPRVQWYDLSLVDSPDTLNP